MIKEELINMILERNDNLDIETATGTETGASMGNGMGAGSGMSTGTSMGNGMGAGSGMGAEPSMGNEMVTGVQGMHDECEKLINYHALFMTKYGSKFDGIVESVRPDYVVILVAEDIVDQGDEDISQGNKKNRDNGYNMQRQYVNPRRYRRFRRRPFQYNTLAGVAVLPYPYYAPPYPYYPF